MAQSLGDFGSDIARVRGSFREKSRIVSGYDFGGMDFIRCLAFLIPNEDKADLPSYSAVSVGRLSGS
jgi:hypothetical protein